jgi:hypothetical protein
MPFTFSHPAAVLPLGFLPRRFISMTGLIAGSMAPDFEYFLRMRSLSFYSHTWLGILWFDLPLTIFLAFIFHQLVRNKLIDNSPLFITRRLVVYKSFDWKKHFMANFLVVIVSIIIGAASHILWDRFTHEGKIFIHVIDQVENDFIIAGYSFSRYRMLQDVSSMIGGLVVVYAVVRLPADKLFTRQNSILSYWRSVLLITVVIVGAWVLFVHRNHFSKNLIIVSISAWLIGLVLTSLMPVKTKIKAQQ